MYLFLINIIDIVIFFGLKLALLTIKIEKMNGFEKLTANIKPTTVGNVDIYNEQLKIIIVYIRYINIV